MPITAYTTQGRRDYQEDRYLAKKLGPHKYFFAICDGHGGKACSEFCKTELERRVVASTKPAELIHIIKSISDNWDEKCLDFLGARQSDINKQWRAGLVNHPKWSEYEEKELSSGSTLCAVMLTKNKMYIISIGDSQAVWKFDNDKTVYSLAHKVRKKSPGLKIPAEIKARRINGVLAVGRAIGDNDEITWGSVSRVPYTKVVDLNFKKKLKLVVGSDGVWEEGVTYPSVMKKPSAKAVGRYAFKRGSSDNITVVMFECVRSK